MISPPYNLPNTSMLPTRCGLTMKSNSTDNGRDLLKHTDLCEHHHVTFHRCNNISLILYNITFSAHLVGVYSVESFCSFF